MKRVVTFAARKRDSAESSKQIENYQQNIFKIYFGEVKKVLTFAVPKQTGKIEESDSLDTIRRLKGSGIF